MFIVFTFRRLRRPDAYRLDEIRPRASAIKSFRRRPLRRAGAGMRHVVLAAGRRERLRGEVDGPDVMIIPPAFEPGSGLPVIDGSGSCRTPILPLPLPAGRMMVISGGVQGYAARASDYRGDA